MEKILTDEEIITAVECCISNTQDCSACVFLGTGIKEKTTCEVKMMKNALDLIKRQQAKEKELQEKLVIYRGMIDHQKAEMERLQAERDMAVKDLHATTKCHICQHLPDDGNMTHCPHYASCGLAYIHFKWRGATKERES